MKPEPLYRVIARTLQARANCIAEGKAYIAARLMHEDNLRDIERNLLPSGSGIDNGCKLEMPDEYDGTFTMTFGYHHMDENGFYCGWTQHAIAVRPSLVSDFDLDMESDLEDFDDRDDLEDYLAQVFDYTLSRPVQWDQERKAYRFAPEPSAASFDVPAVSTASAAEAFAGE